MSNKRFCESCFVPIDTSVLPGKTKDRSMNYYYCTDCYNNGSFTNQGITIHDMEVHIKKVMEEREIPAQVIMLAIKYLPHLKRWRD